MELSHAEAIIDTYHRLTRAVDVIARAKINEGLNEREANILKYNARMVGMEIEDGEFYVSYEYFHPYEGSEEVVIDLSEINIF